MKVKQVLDIGALESEDGLVIIADDKDVWAIDPFVIYYFLEDRQLDTIGVLKLIHEHIEETFLIISYQVGIFSKCIVDPE